MAKIIGTAPLSPTHDIYTRALVVKFLNGNKHRKTVMGRANMIIKIPINRPIPITGNNSEGLTNNPNVRNMTI